MFLVSLALRLLRIAGEALFCFEVNRFLGRAVAGRVAHRKRSMRAAETLLLAHVRAPVRALDLRLPSGLVIHTLIATPHASAAAAPGPNPAVLLHGHSMAAAFFFRNIDHLLALGYSAVYLPDLPGWGSSSRPPFQGRVDDALDFFIAPFEEWLQAVRLPSFTLCGHSLGAYLAHEFAVRRPRAVRRLILASPAAITRHTRFSLALWFALTPQRLLTHGGLIAHVLFAVKYPAATVYNIDGFRQLTLCANSVAHRSGDAAAASMLAFSRVGFAEWKSECVRPLLESVQYIHCPVEIITGDNDNLVHVEAVRTLYRAMVSVGNNVRLNIIPGADHTPHICAPAKFAKAIMRGISTVGATGLRRVNSAIGTTMLVA